MPRAAASSHAISSQGSGAISRIQGSWTCWECVVYTVRQFMKVSGYSAAFSLRLPSSGS